MKPSPVALLILAPLLSVGCREGKLDEARAQEVEVVDAGEIAQRPSSYYGRAVIVVAEVEAVHGPNAFTLDDRAGLDGPDVLVIVPKVAKQVEQAHAVTVRGAVRPFEPAELNRDYAWFDIDSYDPTFLQRFRQRPVIVAHSIRDDQGGDLIVGAARTATSGRAENQGELVADARRPMPVN